MPLLFLPGTLLLRHAPRWSVGFASLPPLIAFILLLQLLPTVMQGQVLLYQFNWIPELRLAVALRLDALSALFALLITGIGVTVMYYAHHYFAGKPEAARFHTLILAFMAAMLGIVLAENLIFMLIFWS